MPLRNFSPLYGKRVLLLTHSGCDVDSFGSAAAMHFSLLGKADTTIGVPEHINNSARALAQKLSVPYTLNPSFSGFDSIVCLDFNEPQMLGKLKGHFLVFKGEKFLIDHHSPNKSAGQIAPPKNCAVSQKAVSATEVVYGLLRASKFKIPQKALACIACGIITDSSSFLVADHETFSIMAEIMRKAKMPYRDIVSLFRVEMDISQKIASLKAARRCRIFKSAGKSGEALIVISDVGSFEADAASTLVRIGADIAFCGDSGKGAIRISGRANNKWLAKEGFDLVRDVFSKLPSFFPGSGGGHPGAAGFNGTGDEIGPVLLKCAQLAHEKISGGGSLKEYA